MLKAFHLKSVTRQRCSSYHFFSTCTICLDRAISQVKGKKKYFRVVRSKIIFGGDTILYIEKFKKPTKSMRTKKSS